MKTSYLLASICMLASTSALAADVDKSALGNSARQSVDVTFAQPLAVTHSLVKVGEEHIAGIMGSGDIAHPGEPFTTLARGKVTVTGGMLAEMQMLAIKPTTPGKDRAGPDYVTGMAVNTKVPADNFTFKVLGKEVKVVDGNSWLLGDIGNEMKYDVIVNKGTMIKAGTYRISIDAAVYSE